MLKYIDRHLDSFSASGCNCKSPTWWLFNKECDIMAS